MIAYTFSAGEENAGLGYNLAPVRIDSPGLQDYGGNFNSQAQHRARQVLGQARYGTKSAGDGLDLGHAG